MSMVAGGSSGITYPNATNTSAATVTAKLAPALTDTANTLYIGQGVVFSGTSGLLANGVLYATAP